MPVDGNLWTDESLDGLGIHLGRDDEDFVVHFEDGVAHRNGDHAVVHDTCADDITVEELGNFLQRAACNVGVRHLQVHDVRLGVRVLSLFLEQFVVLCLEVYLADVPDSDGCTDDAHDTERIGAGIARSDVEVHAVFEDTVQCLVGSTESRRVRHGTV